MARRLPLSQLAEPWDDRAQTSEATGLFVWLAGAIRDEGRRCVLTTVGVDGEQGAGGEQSRGSRRYTPTHTAAAEEQLSVQWRLPKSRVASL